MMHTERPDVPETPEPVTPPETPPRPPDDEGTDPQVGEKKQGDVNHQPACPPLDAPGAQRGHDPSRPNVCWTSRLGIALLLHPHAPAVQ
jgi:hypothetical protein